MFWGISESFDLYQEYLSALKGHNQDNETAETECDDDAAAEKPPVDENTPDQSTPATTTSLNILLFGAGDPRHVIKTIAKRYKHQAHGASNFVVAPSLNFYVLEGCVEIVARSLALLAIALEPPDSLSLRNKVHLFMDVYGNALVRPTSHQYLVGKAQSLLRMVTDPEHLERRAPLLSIEALKYRERDGLENAFNFWLPKEGHVFNMPEYWAGRVRHALGTRYDHREGVFDWDLNMTLKYREAKQICSQEYRYWRETGIAFTFPEYEQCKPNKTLAAGLVRNGEKYFHRGYVGDMAAGPFCTFGLRTSDERLMHSMHGENDYRATDVTERNLLELFHEIQAGSPYEHDKELSHKYGSVRLKMGNCFIWNECDQVAVEEYDKTWLQVEGVKVNYISADEVFNLQDADGRWRGFFDVAFVGHNYFAFIKSSFAEVLRPNALLMLETKLLTLAKKEEVAEFDTKLKSFAKSANLENVVNYNTINANFTVLKFRKQTEEN